jgi:hypothetical protein
MYPVICAAAAIVFAIRGRWELRHRMWFWATMSVLACLHVVLIAFIPWKAGWTPAPVTTLFCIMDVAMIFGIIALIEWLGRLRSGTRKS